MSNETVTYDKEKIVELLRDLEVLVVSTDRIGSAFHDRESDEKYNSMFLRFLDDLKFSSILADARMTLSEPFSDELGADGMDELERHMQGIEYWRAP